MTEQKVFLGSDHNGFELKQQVIEYLVAAGVEVEDLGNHQLDPVDDFPQFAAAVAKQVLDHDAKGILFCGTGQGMCMAANRFRGIRAAILPNADEALEARTHNNANIACLPANLVKQDKLDWQSIVDVFLTTEFLNEERFERRNRQLDNF